MVDQTPPAGSPSPIRLPLVLRRVDGEPDCPSCGASARADGEPRCPA